MRSAFIIAGFAALASLASATPKFASTVQGSAPLLSDMEAEVIPNSYIVVLKDGIKPDADVFRSHFALVSNLVSMANTGASGADANEISHVYEHGLVGYAGRFEPHVIDEIRRSDDVAFVEQDSMVYASDELVQKGAPWGLARTSSRTKLGFGNFNKYKYDEIAGEGVTVYVVDTGVNVQHVDFDGRAKWGKTVPNGDADVDGNGHGTHVGGTIAGTKFGMAKKAEVVAVKVLRTNGSGSMSDVVKGVSYTLDAHNKRVDAAFRAGRVHKGSVANMSLGGGKSPSLDMAVNAAVKGGVHYVVAAGNDNRDACAYSPAAAELAITVGASTLSDDRAYFSNFGKCVDVFAPGLNIQSTWIGSKTATNTISGTSMASPHVAGLAAYFLSISDQSLTPKALKNLILTKATKDALKNVGVGSPNLLIFNDSS